MTPVPPSLTKARSRELLSESVRRRILTAILDGTLVAGERLHDEELTGWLGVSRTPIRTALERLAEIGLVQMEPNRFTRVAIPSRECLLQALQVYAALTVSAVEGAVSTLDEADLVEFRRRLARVETLGTGDHERRWARADLDAVDSVLSFFSQRSNNPLLDALLREVRIRLVFALLTNPVPLRPNAVAEFVRRIQFAVEARDEAAVARVISEHLGSGSGGGPGSAGLLAWPGAGVDAGRVGAGG